MSFRRKGARRKRFQSSHKNYNSTNAVAERRQRQRLEDHVDTKFGFQRYTGQEERMAFLYSMRKTSVFMEEPEIELSCLDLYFVEQDGKTFKGSLIHKPYFLVKVKSKGESHLLEVEAYLKRRFEKLLDSVDRVQKKDLAVLNHLAGIEILFLRLNFKSVPELLAVRKELKPLILKNKQLQERKDTYDFGGEDTKDPRRMDSVLDCCVDIREYDVKYEQRVAIDRGCRAGKWYKVSGVKGTMGIKLAECEREDRPQLKTLAYDIECTKAPLKFPDANLDQIMMISYMIDGKGYLIINREIVSEDIQDFEYTPKPDYPGPFHIFNERNELSTIQRFLHHIKTTKPLIIVTYNGDFFDWPFVDARMRKHGMNLLKEIGIWKAATGEYRGRFTIHMDAFCWVQRDSYLPQGSQGLKAVTRYKLGYDPIEVDPEDMLPFASEQPQKLAAYSVSDAVATYYLYMKYVHSFIFSLCTILPMGPPDVLRKGSGTLCELLLMVKAFEGNIICPDKQHQDPLKFHHGHLLESETYVGGHVEGLESGVFRDDIPYKFRCNPDYIKELIKGVDRIIKFAVCHEGGIEEKKIKNFDDVKQQIIEKLQKLHDEPNIECLPMIYHLDVGAMYPNIILTNRLQPMAIIDNSVCAACDFNKPGKTCQRKMNWSWRGKQFPLSKSEFNSIRQQLEYETITVTVQDDEGKGPPKMEKKRFTDLSEMEQVIQIKKRVKTYSQKVYKRITDETIVEKEAIICQRENPFYVNTVRTFRDRRYMYKRLKKTWSKRKGKAKDPVELAKAKDMVLLYDSMQLAHKCILNSFYGYVMRRGARWHSIEMAGVVTQTGANIIRDARHVVDQIGRPLELDTDGIWCMLPCTFPENFTVETTDKKNPKYTFSYTNTLLNVGVKDKYTNHQYQDLDDEIMRDYKTSSQCTIYFEVDGPYRCMVLPASKEEGKSIKKRYAVFNKDGSLAELKGFEIKRRGELQLIKIFQSEVFSTFLQGKSLQEIYDAVGDRANHWLDILDNEGDDLDDHDLFDLISENKNMSGILADYVAKGNKSTSITCAKRIAEFLGEQMVQDKGLNCKFVISKYPQEASVSERAIPTQIFAAEEAIKTHFLKKWTKNSSLEDFDIRTVLDWHYYRTRLNSAIMKIITIPAAFQKVKNPVPRVEHPSWLLKRLRERDDKYKQARISSFFSKDNISASQDIEDFDPMSQRSTFSQPLKRKFAVVKKRRKRVEIEEKTEETKILEECNEDDFDIDRALESALDEKVYNLEKENDENRAASSSSNTSPTKESAPPPPAPKSAEEFSEWMRMYKENWKQDLNRKRRTRNDTPGSKRKKMKDGVNLKDKTLGQFIEEHASALKTDYWQILQVVENTKSPGSFLVWAIVGDQLQRMQVKVPRVIYINSRTEGILSDANAVKIANRTLPRRRQCFHLYKVTMEERDFIDNMKQLGQFLSRSDIEGVYETQVPLMFKFLINTGCVCKLNKMQSESGLQAGPNEYLMDQLQYKTAADCEYLEPNIANLKYKLVYLYHSFTGSRHLFGLFFTQSARAVVVVATPGNAPLDKFNFAKGLEAAAEEQKCPFIPEGFDIEFLRVQSRADAFRELDSEILRYQSETKKPTILIQQCAASLAEIYHHIPSLKSTFPVVSIASTAYDNQYPALQWLGFAAKRMLQRYVLSFDWWKESVMLCRFAHVPIGNLPADQASFISDIFYARALSHSRHLLWLSEAPRPDLGGNEEDENRFEQEHHNPEIVSKGCYRSVCVEIELANLAVNAVMQDSLIDEVEGITQNTDTDLPSFRILKSMITNWFINCVQRENGMAELLLTHFYRWIRSPVSLMHDPSLHRLVHSLMYKMFLQMTVKFRRLGSGIVYASFQKLIIDTRKMSVHRALAYCKYVIDSIKAKEVFEWISLEPSRVWQALLYLDGANYGGIYHEGEVDDSDQTFSQIDRALSAKDDTSHPEIHSNWDIARYLPRDPQKYFDLMVSEFLFAPYQQVIREVDADGKKAVAKTDEKLLVDIQAKCQEMLSCRGDSPFPKKLFGIIRGLQKIDGDVETEAVDLPGTQTTLAHPALVFSKYVSHVFSLDKNAAKEVDVLRKQMFRMLNIPAFSKQAQFTNPCETYVLPDVICSYCNQCRDLDLCRDPDLIMHEWKCSHCEHQYDQSIIEASLVQVVSKRHTNYQVQDLVCKRCGDVKVTSMGEYCKCSGEYVNRTSPEKFRNLLRKFGNIAKFHRFEWLGEVVNQMLDPLASARPIFES